ncbi:MAG: YggS family pyridoxal phosphate-dependent enzyme [Candidatus Dormibacteria bacterium]
MPAPAPDPQPPAEALVQTATAVSERIRVARERAGGGPVLLLPVTKGHPVQVVRLARAAGFAELGENYLQECQAKALELGEPQPRWHMLGHLQRNKVARAARLFTVVETVDSLQLALALSGARGEMEPLPVLCEVDLTAIPGRKGFRPEELLRVAEPIAQLPGLRLLGLMTVADPAQPQRCFAACRLLRDGLEGELGLPLPVLSMGMSDDFEVAIAEGSTEVRLGGALFGPRQALSG